MLKRSVAVLSLVAIAACDAPSPSAPGPYALDASSALSGSRVVGHANGEGIANVGVPMSFVFNALLREDGSAAGEGFHQAAVAAGTIEFRTRVTCVAIDAVNNRAWIGGVITENNSTDPARLQPRHAVGRDIWWRMVDYGNGHSGTADRTTFIGFTGDAGIQTSADYCATRPWPGPADVPPQPVDARTAALTSGNLSVMLK